MVPAEDRYDFRQAERPVDQIKMASGPQQAGRGRSHILKGAQDLMSGNGLGSIRPHQPVGADHIGRIAGNNVKRGSRKQVRCLSDISLPDQYPVLQTVEPHAPGCHIGTFLLDLESCQGGAAGPGRHQDGNDARPGPQIQSPAARSGLGVPGQEHGIHAETESVRILNDTQAVPLQVINLLARTQILVCRSPGLRFIYHFFLLIETGGPPVRGAAGPCRPDLPLCFTCSHRNLSQGGSFT